MSESSSRSPLSIRGDSKRSLSCAFCAGHLPTQLGDLSKLEGLRLGGNGLNGENCISRPIGYSRRVYRPTHPRWQVCSTSFWGDTSSRNLLNNNIRSRTTDNHSRTFASLSNARSRKGQRMDVSGAANHQAYRTGTERIVRCRHVPAYDKRRMRGSQDKRNRRFCVDQTHLKAKTFTLYVPAEH